MLAATLEYVLAHPIELAGALVNFIWVYLEYKASVWLWPVGIILPLFYIYLS
ncbi:nicotinamide mononucleotide transporter, partial [Porphyromonas loveana]|uniref:nicotinamide mononucleotide transporter n=1 Tax=Porphyromonas loveana TaxID=1884669 RepID=UPI0035A17F46